MICISLGDMSFEECRNHVLSEDFVELRLDLLQLSTDQLEQVLTMPGKKIVTCRQGDYSDDERMGFFLTALNKEVDYIDLELEMPGKMREKIISRARSKGCRVIISHHNYNFTASVGELRQMVQACRAAGADVVKLACQVNEPADNIRLLSLCDEKEQLVIVGMGPLGVITRVAGPLLGALFTYAAPKKEMETATGQLTKDALLQIYGLIGARFD